MLRNLIESVWALLDDEASLFFGKECLSVTLWILLVLMTRMIVLILNLQNLFTFGFLSYLPMILSVFYLVKITVPIPILTCRLAEIIMGRIRPRKLFVLIPAHFLGAIIGTIIFKSIFRTVPLFGKKGILPADIPVDYMMPRILLDCVVVFAFTISINVLPAIVKVNKMSRSFVNLSVLPIFLLSVVDKGNTFNPATLYAIQFAQSENSFSLSYFLRHIYLLGPVIGSLLAGLLLAKYFPDDTKDWQPRPLNGSRRNAY